MQEMRVQFKFREQKVRERGVKRRQNKRVKKGLKKGSLERVKNSN